MPYRHNDGVTILVPTLAEIDEIAAQLAERLVGATGPTAVLIPMRGWSAYDQSAALATRERGWPAGHGDGPTWEPDPAHPMWSRKATRMLAVLRERLPRDHPRLDLIACDRHILDPAFSDLLERCMGEMLDGTWRPGHHRDLDGILPDDVAV